MRLYTRANSPFIWYDVTVAGDRLRGSSKCTGTREARAHVNALIADRLARRGVADEWRLREITGAYWQDNARHRAGAHNIWHYLTCLNTIIGPDVPMRDLTTATLINYRARRRGHSARGCSAVTVNRDLATLRAAINHAVDAYAKTPPAIAWKRVMVRENPWRTRYASADEFARLVTHAHPDLRPLLVAAVTTGLRRANLVSLEWHQVDLAGGIITLPKTKSGRAHAVTITGPLRAALASLAPADTRHGKVFDCTNFRKRWQELRIAAQVPDLRWHDLRHTFASWARLAGADLQSLMEALDHSSIMVTMRYSNVTPHGAGGAFARVAELMAGQGGDVGADAGDALQKKADAA